MVRALKKKLGICVLILLAIFVYSFGIVDSVEPPIFGASITYPLQNATIDDYSVEAQIKVISYKGLIGPSLACDLFLDNNKYCSVLLVENFTRDPSGSHSDWEAAVMVNGLSQGNHTIQLRGKCSYEVSTSDWREPLDTVNIDISSSVVSFQVSSSRQTQQPTQSIEPSQTSQSSQLPTGSFSNMAMLLSGAIAGGVIVCIALVIIYRKVQMPKKVNATSSA
jgi:hypothetical protein